MSIPLCDNKISSLGHFSSVMYVTHLISEKARSADPIFQRHVSNFSGIPRFLHCKVKTPIRRDHSSVLFSWDAGLCLNKQMVLTREDEENLMNK